MALTTRESAAFEHWQHDKATEAEIKTAYGALRRELDDPESLKSMEPAVRYYWTMSASLMHSDLLAYDSSRLRKKAGVSPTPAFQP